MIRPRLLIEYALIVLLLVTAGFTAALWVRKESTEVTLTIVLEKLRMVSQLRDQQGDCAKELKSIDRRLNKLERRQCP
jgi:hypothetical protein